MYFSYILQGPRIQGPKNSKTPQVQNSKHKLLADAGKNTAATPPATEIAEAEPPPAGTTTEHKHKEAAIRALHGFMKENNRTLPLLFGVLNPEIETILVCWALKPAARKIF